MNCPSQMENMRVFQIAYDQNLLFTREELLKTRGYEVTSVFGNDAAKRVLDKSQKYRLFIVGHDAPKETKEEMVRWLKENFSEIKILGLNAPFQEPVTGVDVNVLMNGPEEWLAAVEEIAG